MFSIETMCSDLITMNPLHFYKREKRGKETILLLFGVWRKMEQKTPTCKLCVENQRTMTATYLYPVMMWLRGDSMSSSGGVGPAWAWCCVDIYANGKLSQSLVVGVLSGKTNGINRFSFLLSALDTWTSTIDAEQPFLQTAVTVPENGGLGNLKGGVGPEHLSIQAERLRSVRRDPSVSNLFCSIIKWSRWWNQSPVIDYLHYKITVSDLT